MATSTKNRNRNRNRRQPPRPQADRRRLPVVPLVLAGIVVLAIAAVLIGNAGGNGEDDGDRVATAGVEEIRPVEIAGEPLPEYASSGAGDPAVGTAAPEVTGASFDGTPVRITDDGRPKVIVFLAHWCPHCQKEVPLLAEWLQEHGRPDGVDLYAIATNTTDERPNYPPSKWLEREAFEVPTLADDGEASAGAVFGLSSFPYFVAVDASNTVVARASGEIPITQWEALIERARAGAT